MSKQETAEQIDIEFDRRKQELLTAWRRELADSLEDLERERLARLERFHREIEKAAKEAAP